MSRPQQLAAGSACALAALVTLIIVLSALNPNIAVIGERALTPTLDVEAIIMLKEKFAVVVGSVFIIVTGSLALLSFYKAIK